jgi:cyclophilin family peptidyl-prolyl cis-trans isomerase
MTPGKNMSNIRWLITVALGVGLCVWGSLAAAMTQAEDKHPIVVLDTSFGPITLELDGEKAPISVANFLQYVDAGFYDNLVFHRVIPRFMIQGGGMDAHNFEKWEGIRAAIRNESGNGLGNKRGSIAMARAQDPNSATCQFYINLVDNDRLDKNRYAVFGKVVEGLEVVDKIAKVDTYKEGIHDGLPIKPIVIKSARRKSGRIDSERMAAASKAEEKPSALAEFAGNWVGVKRHDGGLLTVLITIDKEGKAGYKRTRFQEGGGLDFSERSTEIKKTGKDFAIELLDGSYRCRLKDKDTIEMTLVDGKGPKVWSFGRQKK